MYLLRKIFVNFRTVHGILYHSLKYLWNTYVRFSITYETLLSVILLFAEDYIPYIIYITHYITH